MAKFPDLRKFADPLGLGARPNNTAPNVPTAKQDHAPEGVRAGGGQSNVSTQQPSAQTQINHQSNEVAKMQEQLLALHNRLQQSQLFNKPVDRNLYEEKAANPGASTFKSFFFDHFVSGSNIKGTYGEQPYPGDVPGQKTKPLSRPIMPGDDIVRMIDTLQQIGTPTKTGSNKPDGVWGDRTNNALKNAYAILHGMKEFASKMGLQAQFPKEIEDLPKAIPATSKSLKNPDETANSITKILLTSLSSVGRFLETIENDKRFASDATLLQVQQQKQQLTQVDAKAVFNEENPYFPMPIQANSIGEHGNIELNLMDLWDKDRFESFIKRNNILVDGQSPLEKKELMPKLLANLDRIIKESKPKQTLQAVETR